MTSSHSTGRVTVHPSRWRRAWQWARSSVLNARYARRPPLSEISRQIVDR